MPWKLKISGTKAIIKVMPDNIENRLNNVRKMNDGKGYKNPPHADIKLPKHINRAVTGAKK